MAEDVQRVHDQEAAVRPVERPRLDLAEVGDHRPERGPVLDPPEQVVVRRVVLDDDRRAGEAVVLDEDVDAEAPVVLWPQADRKRQLRRTLAVAEVGQVGEKVCLRVPQVGEHLRLLVGILELAEQAVGREQRDLVLELLHPA